jgi:hypothetical protein
LKVSISEAIFSIFQSVTPTPPFHNAKHFSEKPAKTGKNRPQLPPFSCFFSFKEKKNHLLPSVSASASVSVSVMYPIGGL